jgi:hypothetical protein
MFRRGVFDFGDAGTSQFSPFLNVSGFIQMAWEEDLLVIFRLLFSINCDQRCYAQSGYI